MTEASKKFMTMSIWSAVIVLIIRCLIGWTELSEFKVAGEIFKLTYTFIGYIGEAIAISSLFMWAFNKWWWKYKVFNFLAGGMPVLSKSYKGKIRFVWEEKEQERGSEIGIEQTFLNVTVKLGTDESSSNSVTAVIKEENGSKMLIYTYLNTPRAEIQNRSAIHYGTAMLSIDDPKHLTGNYFTTRQSRGSMDFMAVEEETKEGNQKKGKMATK